ncbi:MAG: putative transrane protein [Proteobacteria bacterium]|nr:putative transrane protein [Pseudomonadota bacterium]
MCARTPSCFRKRPVGWLAAMLLAWTAFAFGQPDSEPQLEAAYLVNFMKYVDWPANNRPYATICLFGRETLGPFLTAYEGRSVGGKELRIRRANSPDDMANCQLVFIPDVEEARIGAVLRWVYDLPILTVSDSDGFTRLGGGIELTRSSGRIQFIVNAASLSRNGLTPSSQMLRLAQRVIGVDR